MSDAKPGALLGVIGGLVAAGGVFLTWGSATASMPGVGSSHYTVSGLDMGYGKAVLALGLVAAATAILTYVLRQRPAAVFTAVCVVTAGALAAILGIMTVTGIKDAVVDPIVQQAGVSVADFTDAARRFFVNAMEAGAGWGLYLAILGGCIALAGGVLQFLDLRRSPEVSADVTEAVGIEG